MRREISGTSAGPSLKRSLQMAIAPLCWHPPRSWCRISIGNDVWIGAGAQVLSGVTLGDDAIVAAGIVTRDVAPYAIVAGNPAQFIRYRFGPDRIEQLLALQWWHRSEDRLRSEAAFLTEVHERPQ